MAGPEHKEEEVIPPVSELNKRPLVQCLWNNRELISGMVIAGSFTFGLGLVAAGGIGLMVVGPESENLANLGGFLVTASILTTFTYLAIRRLHSRRF